MALGADPGFNEPALRCIKDLPLKSLQSVAEKHDEDSIAPVEVIETISSKVQSEALSALTNLGYPSYDAALAVTTVMKDQDSSVELQELIKLALQRLALKV